MSHDNKAAELPQPSLPPTPLLAGTNVGSPSEEATMIGLIRALLVEQSEQRKQDLKERQDRAAEERRKLLWRRVFLTMGLGLPILLAVLYFFVFMKAMGTHLGPWNEVVGIVRIQGPIMADKQASADRVIPALEEAFASRNVKAVVLSIDSPGGSPSESERIYRAVDALKKKHSKPVVAVIDNLGASAAYLIAIHADRIVAGKYSLVGSIGAIMETWQLDRALAKVDVAQRVYASGRLKSFLNPFTPPTPDADAKAKQVVTQVANTFLGELKATRGSALKPNVDYGTGEVWVGEEAKQIGLVDEIGTLDQVVETSWGLKTYKFGPAESGLGILSRAMSSATENLLERALMGNYGQLH